MCCPTTDHVHAPIDPLHSEGPSTNPPTTDPIPAVGGQLRDTEQRQSQNYPPFPSTKLGGQRPGDPKPYPPPPFPSAKKMVHNPRVLPPPRRPPDFWPPRPSATPGRGTTSSPTPAPCCPGSAAAWRPRPGAGKGHGRGFCLRARQGWFV